MLYTIKNEIYVIWMSVFEILKKGRKKQTFHELKTKIRLEPTSVNSLGTAEELVQSF
jgi:hypothetical protein